MFPFVVLFLLFFLNIIFDSISAYIRIKGKTISKIKILDALPHVVKNPFISIKGQTRRMYCLFSLQVLGAFVMSLNQQQRTKFSFPIHHYKLDE